MKRTSYGTPLVPGHRRKMDWRQWEKDFLSGRTHVAYGLIVSTAASSTGILMAQDVALRALFLVSAIASAGALVDTVSHLYWH